MIRSAGSEVLVIPPDPLRVNYLVIVRLDITPIMVLVASGQQCQIVLYVPDTDTVSYCTPGVRGGNSSLL